MWKRNLSVIGLAVLVAAMSSCIFSPEKDTGDPVEPAKKFEDLSQRSHVLNNIELAYNKRNITQYDRLLDDNFTFFFSTGDVGGGLPQSWGRADELVATTAMFDPNYTGENRCKSIRMDLQFEDGVTWVEVIPGSAPDEVWYTTTVFYEFKIDTEPDNTWLAVPGAKAQFTVRNTGTESAPLWKLVEFRDLGESN
jgi:hypothetical protein